jgi:hypothetical protein
MEHWSVEKWKFSHFYDCLANIVWGVTFPEAKRQLFACEPHQVVKITVHEHYCSRWLKASLLFGHVGAGSGCGTSDGQHGPLVPGPAVHFIISTLEATRVNESIKVSQTFFDSAFSTLGVLHRYQRLSTANSHRCRWYLWQVGRRDVDTGDKFVHFLYVRIENALLNTYGDSNDQ